MPKISVTIEYDWPTDPYWLNPDNVATALHNYCANTNFRVTWAKNGDPWPNRHDGKLFVKARGWQVLYNAAKIIWLWLTQKSRQGHWYFDA